jgi:hypothetical protein
MMAGIAEALLAHPIALGTFAFALMSVVLGGSALMFLIKGGALTTLVEADRVVGPSEGPPLRIAAFERAGQFSINLFLAGCAHLFRRYFRLGLLLLTVYALSGALYLALIVPGYRLTSNAGMVVLWTVVAFGLVTLLVAWITLVNLFYLLTQMVIAANDVSVRTAARHVIRFVRENALTLGSVFGVVLAFVILATIASVVATAALGLISFVPLVGLAVFPLQVVAWLVRGLVFQYLGFTAFASYLALYRGQRGRLADTADWIRTA